MKIAGVITEYNPFHRGHKYQLDEIRRRTGADYLVVFMSGDFVQRGGPAITDKFIRTEMALRGGADLVVMLPVVYSTGSAELFAFGGIDAMKKSGIIDAFCFGAETDDLASLQKLASLLAHEPEQYRLRLQEALKSSLSFPAAREMALREALPEFSPAYLHELLSSSNNILGLEYLKAAERLRFEASPVLIPRVGSGYREEGMQGEYSSATAIRGLLREYTSPTAGGLTDELSDRLAIALPEESRRLLTKAAASGKLLFEDDLSVPLFYALLQQKFADASPASGKQPTVSETFSGKLSAGCGDMLTVNEENLLPADCDRQLPADCDRQLLNRILDAVSGYTTFTEFASSLKSRNYTYTHICRALLHILLQISENDRIYAGSGLPYLRVLGFKRSSSEVLKFLQEHSSIPVITKPADYAKVLKEEGQNCFQKDLFAAELYLHSNKPGRRSADIKYKNDLSHPMVIL